MNINGRFEGKALKITVDTLLDQFRRRFGSKAKAGELNFLVEFQLTSQSDAGSPEQAEAQLNQLLGAVRCLSDQQSYGVAMSIQAIPGALEEMTRDTQRLVESQLAALAPQVVAPTPKKLIIPGGA